MAPATNPHPLRAYRAETGLSLEQLAGRFGVNKTTVMRWEDGRVPAERVVEVETATGIARARLRPDLYPSQQAVV